MSTKLCELCVNCIAYKNINDNGLKHLHWQTCQTSEAPSEKLIEKRREKKAMGPQVRDETKNISLINEIKCQTMFALPMRKNQDVKIGRRKRILQRKLSEFSPQA